MGGALIMLLLLPWLNTSTVRSTAFRPIYRTLYWIIIANFLILGWIGQNVVETPYIEVGQFTTALYFAFFLIIVPGLGVLENILTKDELI